MYNRFFFTLHNVLPRFFLSALENPDNPKKKTDLVIIAYDNGSISTGNWGFWVAEFRIGGFGPKKNFNNPENPYNPEKTDVVIIVYDNGVDDGKLVFWVGEQHREVKAN